MILYVIQIVKNVTLLKNVLNVKKENTYLKDNAYIVIILFVGLVKQVILIVLYPAMMIAISVI